MARALILVCSCLLVASTALGLRVRSHLAEQALDLGESISSGVPIVDIPVPPDFVVHPQVAPGEEANGPRRIISLAPSITETLCALGLLDHLVGRTEFCFYPPTVNRIPALGALLDTNVEKIRAMEPDLVMTTANSVGVNQKLERLGIRHASLPHESLEDVFLAIERGGELFARPQTARHMCAAIRADLERLQTEARRLHAKPLRVLMITGGLPVPPGAVWVAGPGSCLDDLLILCGHENAVAGTLKGQNGEIPLELLPVIDPDVILTFPLVLPTAEQMTEAYRSWWKLDLRAIRTRRVRAVGTAEWLSAGPRIAVEFHRFVTVMSEFREE